MVPAGSVYFFEVKDGNPRDLAEKGWLATVSDKDRRKGTFDAEDGFGLAIWGAWQPLCEKLVEETERVARN
jgi:CRISPR-associated protein Cmr3